MIVRSCLHVHLSETVDGEKHFGCGQYHCFEDFFYEFASNSLSLQCCRDQEKVVFENLTLSVSPFENTLLRGFGPDKDVPLVLFQFADTAALAYFAGQAGARYNAAGVLNAPTVAPTPQAVLVTDATVALAEHAVELVAQTHAAAAPAVQLK